jgi:hypothetical protein
MARGTFADVEGQIESEAGIAIPTMAQIADLAEFAYDRRSEPEFEETVARLNGNILWGFKGILYLPKAEGDYQNGAIIQDRPDVANGRVSLNKAKLIGMLEAGDKSVRFVPFGYKTGVQSAADLTRNPFVRGLAGEERAERIAELASKYPNSPRVRSFDNVNELIARVSCLLGSSGDRLFVGDNWDDYDIGCAPGVLVGEPRSGEAAQKK